MDVIREHFRLSKLKLQNDNASDFYLSCFHTSRVLPLLCIRLVLFLGCIGIILSSMLLPERIIFIDYWAIFMTQWGVVMILVTNGLATAVSAVAYFKGSIDATSGLPWYVRLFWACCCITVPQAFHITIFYYALVNPAVDYDSVDYDLNLVLDVFTHGINSVIMFTMLMTSNITIYCAQFVYPAVFYIIYMIFTLIYFYAGGTNPFGDPWIYPVLDWTYPGDAVVTVVLSLVLLIGTFLVAVSLSLLRNYLTRRFRATSINISYKP